MIKTRRRGEATLMITFYLVAGLFALVVWVGLFLFLVEIGWRLNRYWQRKPSVDVWNTTTARLIRDAEFEEARNRFSAVPRAPARPPNSVRS